MFLWGVMRPQREVSHSPPLRIGMKGAVPCAPPPNALKAWTGTVSFWCLVVDRLARAVHRLWGGLDDKIWQRQISAMRRRCESGHWHPSTADVINEWSYSCTSPYAFMACTRAVLYVLDQWIATVAVNTRLFACFFPLTNPQKRVSWWERTSQNIFFFVLLTVHLSIILVINQLDAQNLVL